MRDLTQERVKYLFDYTEDGSLVCKHDMNQRLKKGMKPGYLNGGYIEHLVDNIRISMAKTIFLWHHGYMPENEIDHIDQDKINKRVGNLRETSRSCNIKNQGNSVRNTSGVKGVSCDYLKGKWKVAIAHNKRWIHVAYCEDFNEAVLHRLAAEQCLAWQNCNIASPAYLYARINRLIGR